MLAGIFAPLRNLLAPESASILYGIGTVLAIVAIYRAWIGKKVVGPILLAFLTIVLFYAANVISSPPA